jgi:fructose-specific phosphotransferase system IIC component
MIEIRPLTRYRIARQWSGSMNGNNQLARLIAVSGCVISGLLAVLIVGGVIWGSFTLGRVPEPLSNWGGIIIGFFFGQFFSFVRAVLAVPEPDKGRLTPS